MNLYDKLDAISIPRLPPECYVQTMRLGRQKFHGIFSNWTEVHVMTGDPRGDVPPTRIGPPLLLCQEDVAFLQADNPLPLERAKPVIRKIEEHFDLCAQLYQLI